MSEYCVNWRIEIDAETPREAVIQALEIMRDTNSTALIFQVRPRCECGIYHADDETVVDLLSPEHVHHVH